MVFFGLKQAWRDAPGPRHWQSWVAAGLVLTCLTLAVPARSQETLVPPGQQLEDLIVLTGTYQSCYFNVVTVSCFQLYSSMGIIATDFASGNINATTALDALDHNSLLLTTCLTTLEQVRQVSPEDDLQIQAEIDRLTVILETQNELLTALNEVCYEPSDRSAARVEACRRNVEAAIDAYVDGVDVE